VVGFQNFNRLRQLLLQKRFFFKIRDNFLTSEFRRIRQSIRFRYAELTQI
jgi:hypothetical protein